MIVVFHNQTSNNTRILSISKWSWGATLDGVHSWSVLQHPPAGFFFECLCKMSISCHQSLQSPTSQYDACDSFTAASTITGGPDRWACWHPTSQLRFLTNVSQMTDGWWCERNLANLPTRVLSIGCWPLMLLAEHANLSVAHLQVFTARLKASIPVVRVALGYDAGSDHDSWKNQQNFSIFKIMICNCSFKHESFTHRKNSQRSLMK